MVIPLDQRPRSGPYSGLTARSAKRFLTQAFTEAGLPFAEDDALEIVLDATGLDRTGLILNGTTVLDPEIFEVIKANMVRRLSGEPVDHILGWREFFGRRFRISKGVLSPRADTETLIRAALEAISKIKAPQLLDLGTGSGAIGLTILAERPDATLVATDLSDTALHIAKKNAAALGLSDRVSFAQGTWWEAIASDAIFDAVLSNPPYINESAMAELEREVSDYDPALALKGGPDGLRDYRTILSYARDHIRPGGWFGLEIGFDQGDSVSALVKAAGFMDIDVIRDLGGNDRVISAYTPS